MVKKHLLILNWQFPPNAGIGGRRSAKLAKEWKNLGHEITILTQSTSGTNKGSQSWINEEDVNAFDYFFIQISLSDICFVEDRVLLFCKGMSSFL